MLAIVFIYRLMSFPNNKLGAKNPDTLRREVIEESGGQGEEPYPNSYFALLLSEMDEEERSILHRIWDLKREIRVKLIIIILWG